MANNNNFQIFRLKEEHRNILNDLVTKGYFANKTEAVRGGLLELGVKYGLLGADGNGENTVAMKKSRGKK